MSKLYEIKASFYLSYSHNHNVQVCKTTEGNVMRVLFFMA